MILNASLGIFHPYLHLGYAFEFNQPALVAEALAMAAVHDPDMEKMGPVFTESERLARESSGVGHKSLRELMEDMRADKVLASSIDGDNQIDRSKNVADHATKQMVDYAAQYSLSEDQLEEKMHEMIDTCCMRSPRLTRHPRGDVLTCGISFADCYETVTHQSGRAPQDRLLSVAFGEYTCNGP